MRTPQHAMQLSNQMIGLTRLHQDRRHPCPVGALVHVGGPVGRHRDNGDAARSGQQAEIGGERETVAARQSDVGHDHVRYELERPGIRVLRRLALGHTEAPAFEELGVAFARERIVFDEQDQRSLWHGSPRGEHTSAGGEEAGGVR